jgi:hypothetical protein
MKNVTISLSPERSEKLKAISEATAAQAQSVFIAGRNFEVEPRKLSASAIAISLLNAAIDDAHAHI